MHNISTTSSFIGFDQEYDTSPVVLVGITVLKLILLT